MSRKAGSIPEETRAKLMKSAVAEFSELGYEKASLRRICSRADVTTGALYFFFQDKEALFENILLPVTGQLLSLMENHYKMELASPILEITNDDSEDIRAGEQLLELFYKNQTVCNILLSNRDHPFVSHFFDQITELISRQSVLLLNRIHISVQQYRPYPRVCQSQPVHSPCAANVQ